MAYALLVYLSVGCWFAVQTFFAMTTPPPVFRALMLATLVPLWPIAAVRGLRKKRSRPG